MSKPAIEHIYTNEGTERDLRVLFNIRPDLLPNGAATEPLPITVRNPFSKRDIDMRVMVALEPEDPPPAAEGVSTDDADKTQTEMEMAVYEAIEKLGRERFRAVVRYLVEQAFDARSKGSENA